MEVVERHEDGTDELDTIPIRNDRGDLSLRFIAAVKPSLRSNDRAALKALIEPLHEADVGDLLETLSAEERHRFIQLLGEDFDFAVLTELDEGLRAPLLEELPEEAIARGIEPLEADDAAAIIEDLSPEEQKEVLSQLPLADRTAIAGNLDFPEDSAGRLMHREFVAVPPYWTVGQTIDHLREEDDLPDEFYQLVVVDPGFHPIGTVALDTLLRTHRPTIVSEITDDTVYKVEANDDQEEVARMFERYNLLSAPVVDGHGRMVGVINVDDIVDVIEEEADEDMLRLAGVGDDEGSERVLKVAGSRIPWLLVNVLTGFLAAAVIGLFDGTIEQMVILAALMPIVASMGGNAGTQAMTVTVRAIATRDIATQAAVRVIVREMLVALLNGCIVAVAVGIGIGLFFGDANIGAVIGGALVLTIFIAGIVGVIIPLGLDRVHIDPAVASGVLLTAVTDVTGFFVFLGLAGWWFGLF